MSDIYSAPHILAAQTLWHCGFTSTQTLKKSSKCSTSSIKVFAQSHTEF